MYTKQQIKLKYIPTPEQEADFSFKYDSTTPVTCQNKFIQQLSQYLVVTHNDLSVLREIHFGICEALSQLFNTMAIPDWHNFCSTIFAWNGTEETLAAPMKTAFELLWKEVKRYYAENQSVGVCVQYPGTSLIDYLNQAQRTCILSNPWHTIAIKPIVDSSFWYLYDPNQSGFGFYVSKRNVLAKLHYALGSIIIIETQEKIVPIIGDIEAFVEEGGLLILDEVDNCQSIIQRINTHGTFSKHSLEGLLIRTVKGSPIWSDLLLAKSNELNVLVIRLLFMFIGSDPNSAKHALTKSLVSVPDASKNLMIEALKLYLEQQRRKEEKQVKIDFLTDLICDSIRPAREEIQQKRSQPRDPLKIKPAITKSNSGFFKSHLDDSIKARLRSYVLNADFVVK